MDYRKEIDGLRAIAVIAVVVFHLDEHYLAGGFLGVDIFLIISGFLITSIISPQIEAGNFYFLGFIKKRFLRLYPALSLMVACTLIVGSFILLEPERGDLFGQGVAALTSIENIYILLTTGGYWDSSTEYISLLHTWSLSLEEQFYIIFPLILIVLYRYKPQYLKLSLITLTVLSLAIHSYSSFYKPEAGFYLLHARLWQFMLGALVAIFIIPIRKTIVNCHLGIIGLLVILSSLFCYKEDLNYGGIFNIFISLGSMAFILGNKNELIFKIMSNSLLVWLGKVSYSLYLWHWPVIVYMKYVNPHFNTFYCLLFILVATLCSYYLVEKPFRFNLAKYKYVSLVPVFVAILSIIFLITHSQRNPLLKDYGNINDARSLKRGKLFESKDWLLYAKKNSPPQTYDIILTGSSHALVLAPAIEEFSLKNNLKFKSLATSGIYLSTNNIDSNPKQNDIIRARERFFQNNNAKLIILAERWGNEIKNDTFPSDFDQNIRLLQSTGAKVFVLSQVPEIHVPHYFNYNLRQYLLNRTLKGGSKNTIDSVAGVATANDLISDMCASYESVVFIDIHSPLLNSDGYVDTTTIDSIFIYADPDHLNEDGGKLLTKSILGDKINEIFLSEEDKQKKNKY